jgi:hypothetical protein
VLRRNWSTGVSTLVVVAGTASANAPQVLPSGVDLVLNAGLDQVLALVQITNGQSLPTAVVDRRLQASKVFTAQSTSALPTASAALYGAEAVCPDGRYRCGTFAGSPAWVKTGAPTVVTSGFAVTGSGFTVLSGVGSAELAQRYSVNGAEIQYDLSVRRNGGGIQCGGMGDMPDTLVTTVSGIRPDQVMPVTFYGRGGATSTTLASATFFGYMSSNGSIYVANGMPNSWLATAATGPSLSCCIKFTKES